MTPCPIITGQKRSPQEKYSRIGRDELNLADWRISVPTHQQPRKEDGGKLDVIEYTIPTKGRRDQRVTLMAPSVVGLPTPADEDLLLALLCLAKEQGFERDTVHFSTTQLCDAMHRSVNKATRDRIEEGLTRLKALTIKYEFTWYDKIKAEVKPILITGILAEAKFVRREGRPRRFEPHDSYVQWTKNFFKNVTSGNLTDIDLDLYFSFSRPGARQLYRHLNKRFYRKQQDRYERDLVQLACGHLGMKRSKYLKRNFDLCVQELEKSGYILPEASTNRYRNVRKGVWRVGFTLAPEHRRTTRRRGVGYTDGVAASGNDAASRLVRDFHRLWSGAEECRAGQGELAIAERLIEAQGAETIADALPNAVKVLKSKWPDCKTFKGVESYIDDALRPLKEQHRRKEMRRKEEEQRHEETRQQQEESRRNAELEQIWSNLSPEAQADIRSTALRGHPVDAISRRPKLAHSLCLVELARRQSSGSEEGQLNFAL